MLIVLQTAMTVLLRLSRPYIGKAANEGPFVLDRNSTPHLMRQASPKGNNFFVVSFDQAND
ncbi:MAG TPA: hypothetical protein VE178_17500 [Silvibacterium sp.]|nr:hypothetical protein [Silvibacterium sp.]